MHQLLETFQTGELWGAFCEYLWAYWLRYNDTTLLLTGYYVAFWSPNKRIQERIKCPTAFKQPLESYADIDTDDKTPMGLIRK